MRHTFLIPLLWVTNQCAPDEACPDFTTRASMQSGVRVMVMVMVKVGLAGMGVTVPRDNLQTTIWIHRAGFWPRAIQIPKKWGRVGAGALKV